MLTPQQSFDLIGIFGKVTKGMLENIGTVNLARRLPLLCAVDGGKHITGQTLAVEGGVSAVH